MMVALRWVRLAAMGAVTTSQFGPGARVLAPCRDDSGELRWAAATVVSASGANRRLALDHLADPAAPAGAWDIAADAGELFPMGPEPMATGGSVGPLLLAAGRALGLSGGQLLEVAGESRDRGVSRARARVVRALKDGLAGGKVTWGAIAAALNRDREAVRSLYARTAEGFGT